MRKCVVKRDDHKMKKKLLKIKKMMNRDKD